jgi:hypothetical protein
MLVVLDKLTPAERLAFVLHDMFAVPFEEIAPIVGRSAEATRQLASRARRRGARQRGPRRNLIWFDNVRSSMPFLRRYVAAISKDCSPSSIRIFVVRADAAVTSGAPTEGPRRGGLGEAGRSPSASSRGSCAPRS